MSAFKPMLAGKAPAVESVRYPALVSPKLDGVRALVRDGRVLSRNLIELPNQQVQELFGDKLFEGFDGELIVGDPTAPDAFRKTSSVVMSDAQTHEELRFHVFDDWTCGGAFLDRLEVLKTRIRRSSKIIKVVPHLRVVNHHGLVLYEEDFVSQGYEGIMLRDPHGDYKFGRSTTKEGLLLKLKRFEDAEAVVLGTKDLQHNANDDRTGGLAQRRSSKQAGKVARQLLGALQVRGVNGQFKGVKFDVGSGFKLAEREQLYKIKHELVGRVVSYRFFPLGSKDKPRFPTFRGFRDPIDL